MAGRLAAALHLKRKAAISTVEATPEPQAPAKRSKTTGNKLGAKSINQPATHLRNGLGEKDDSEDEALGHGIPGDAPAYQTLVQMFTHQKSEFAASLRQRQKQELGDSDGEEEGDSEARSSDASSSEDDGSSSEEELEARATVARGAAREQPSADHASTKDGASTGTAVAEVDPDDDMAWDAGERLEAAAAAGGPSSSPAIDDHWQAHWEHVLTADQVAELAAGKTKFQDAEGELSQGIWPSARLQLSGCSMPAAPARLAGYGIRERLQSRWKEVHQVEDGPNAATLTDSDFVSDEQRAVFAMCSTYADVFYTARPYPTSSSQPDPVLDAVLLHCINHVTRSADRVRKNNERLRSQELSVAETPRDQGFTRPRVLLLLPQRNLAFKAIRRLVQLTQKETRADSVQGKEKLVEQFAGDGEEEQEGQGDAAAGGGKPAEHRALFAGNVDDHFRLGIKITRGAVRLFVDFFEADVVVASPIALATRLAEDRGGQGSDWMSSLEVVVVDRADVLTMQNWAHVQTVFQHLNQLPKAQHGVDIMRVRPWHLSGHARCYRQTILMSSFATPDMNQLFQRHAGSHAGKMRLKQQPAGVLTHVVPQVQQLFERFTCSSPADAPDARFDFFRQSVWPRLRDSGSPGLLLFVPSYFDFVRYAHLGSLFAQDWERLRRLLTAEGTEFAPLSEYATRPQAQRARMHFFHKRRRVLLYTERAHFYNRYRIRGIKDVVFYGLPEHAHFFSELLNLLEDAAGGGSGHATVTALFSCYDALQLERVVGCARARKMLSAQSGTFMFC